MTVVEKDQQLFGKEKVFKALLKIAPPVMFSQLIQALYNVVDSLFLGHYSDSALNALTIIYPFQYIAIALSIGIGVGVNTFMAKQYALRKDKEAENAVGVGFVINIIAWVIFAIISLFLMNLYVGSMANTEETLKDGVTYGLITCVGSLFIFLEANFSRSHQARGNMIQPMLSQSFGALTNIILDPILIFGLGFIPSMGVAGAAIATVIGQFVAFLISIYKGFRKPPKLNEFRYYTKNIFFYGYSAGIQQILFSLYISILNLILAKFGESAITVLGLYYKLQSFFFIPIFGLTTCIIPFLSYNAARNEHLRCREIMKYTWLISAVLMIIGMACFIGIPESLLRIFTSNEEVIQIGLIAFPIIGSSFAGAIFSLSAPTFFQAIGKGVQSTILVLLRQIVCLVPIMYAFSFIGVNYTWIAFPIAETTTGLVGIILYMIQIHKWKNIDLENTNEKLVVTKK